MSEAATQELPDEEIKVHAKVDEAAEAEIKAAEAKAGQTVEMIPVALIEKSDIALRGVNRQSEEFQLLVRSVKKKGVLQSLLVRKIELPGGITKYGLIDGLQRFSAAQEAGVPTVPARIVEMDDAEMLEAQVITNMNRIQTKPAELSKHLLRMLTRNPMLTVQDLSEKVCQSITWINQRLSLNNLTEEIKQLVNETKIPLSNAYALSKLPEDEQAQHVDAAMTEQPATFVPRMKERVKEIRDAKNAGRDKGPAEFKPTQHLQKVGDVKREFGILTGEEKGDSQVLKVLKSNGVTITEDIKKAAELITAWTLHFDPQSQEEQKKKDEERKKKREEAKKRAKKEREEKKEKEAARDAANLEKF